MPSFKLG
ncbi:uncharacterized protein FRV6_04354 [Fusarium oxysporum]|nr:uncharacterized protein FRV6_04354 [Fusarium oxysporum]